MPTIKDKIHFNFNGVSSRVHKVMHVVLDNGMYEETFVASREINETTVRGNKKPLLHGVEEAPLQFEMVIAFDGKFTDQQINDFIRWLWTDTYKPLYFEGKENRVYYCMPVDDSSIVHNGMNEGYVTIMMRCNSSQIFSPTITTSTTTVTTTPQTITLNLDSHFDVYPEISIKKNGAGTVTIESLDDGGNIFEVRDLTNLEDIYINCEKEIIQTDIIGVYRYDKIVGHFPRLLYGQNRIKITGACEIQFRYQSKYRF
ncbi:tail protein [Bacillus phage vB_BanS_Sophrita]|uniref:Tail protein n=1 Tax=Bacillus phage vB_BanS_Sophrita TaxID=2894790 RepID=A0AAE8YU42_9CAUD|nr:tail protein [Bacillus phage vB_BanS_Sophrita]UGO50798.1 tail protein [Bacillus phage vB_BanS_Sophrita]